MKKQNGIFKRGLGLIGIVIILISVIPRLLSSEGIKSVSFCINPFLLVGIVLTLIGFDVIKTGGIGRKFRVGFETTAEKVFGSRKKARKWLIGIAALLCIPCSFYGAISFWAALDGVRDWASWDIYVILITGFMFIMGVGLASLSDKL